jgi:hypothetical protein
MFLSRNPDVVVLSNEDDEQVVEAAATEPVVASASAPVDTAASVPADAATIALVEVASTRKRKS